MDNFTDDSPPSSKALQLYRIPTRVLSQVRSRPFTSDFVVTEIGYLPTASDHLSTKERTHRTHLLIFFQTGSCLIRIKGTGYPINEKQAVFIPAGTSYQYGPNPDSQWSQYWLKFESSGTENLLDWTSFSEENPVVSCTAAENVKRHFNAILNAVQRGYTEHTTLQLSLAIIKILISLHENPLDKDGNGSTNQIETAMNLMREHVSTPQPLKCYAQKAGYSVTQFSHLFRQHTGTSPINYLNELRIQKAAELLNNTDRSIKHIAHELGFEDPLYFSRNFRKCVGLSPSAYRKR